jgi:penicillin-binding protein 2
MFQRRLLWVTALLLAGMGVLITRLLWLQVIQGQKYVQLSQQEFQPPGSCSETIRGQILDCRGRVLALDRPTFDICLHYKLTRLYDERYIRARLAVQRKATKREEIREDLKKQREQAEELLENLSRLCNVPLDEIRSQIDQINNRFFLIQTVQARKRYYQSIDEVRPPEPNAVAIRADFVERIPDPQERLKRIFQRESAVWEMNQPQVVIQNVSEDIALTLEDRIIGPWIGAGYGKTMICIQNGKSRHYPFDDTACHLLGQLRKAPSELINLTDSSIDPSLEELQGYRLGDRVGEWGIEYLFEKQLQGQRGWIRYDSAQQVVTQIERVLGQDVTLTVDLELHRKIQPFFEADNPQQKKYRGAAVVIDIPTGHIRALVSVPTFDLNTYYQKDIWEFLNLTDMTGEDPNKRKINRAIYKNYEPGSTIKPTLLVAALDAGVVSQYTTYDCIAHSMDMLWKSHCYNTGHGMVNAYDSIKRSCNFFFIDVGQRMGPVKVIECLRQAGFGQRVLAWPEGITGPTRYGSFRETPGNLWPNPSPRELQFMCVGLGRLDANIVQIANSMATIARDGIFKNPTLVQEPKAPVSPRRITNSLQNLRLVQHAMYAVIYEAGGTANEAFQPISWPDTEVRLHGKTGSTTLCSVFSGYALANDGRGVALAVLVEDRGGGGAVAAPIAKRIFDACGELGYLPIPQLRDTSNDLR